jgi:hypothetical protein
MSVTAIVRSGLLLGILAAFSGCSGGSDAEGGSRKPVFKVTGKITFSGGPVSGAMVGFIPREGQPVATGRTNDSGVYTLMTYEPGDGAAKGDYSVTVFKSASGGGPAVEVAHGPSAEGTSSHDAKETAADDEGALPAVYKSAASTTLNATVEVDGKNTFDFDLQ